MPHRKPGFWLDILGNRHRRRIIQLCSVRPLYPQKIAEILGITVPAVIKHLQELEKYGIVVKKTEPRAEGGRELQYYYVPFRPRFNFNLASDDLVEIDITDESDKEVPSTPSRGKIIDLDSITSEEVISIRENVKTFIHLEHERIEVTKKLNKLHEKQRFFFRSMRSTNSPQQQILLKIIRFILDRYGFDEPFSQQDLEKGLGIDIESAKDVLQILSGDLNIISKIYSENPVEIEQWIINPNETKDSMDYG